MDITDILYAKKLSSGGGGGGGGSSDFSTAEVTLNGFNGQYVKIPMVIEDRISCNNIEIISPIIITVPLYKGKLNVYEAVIIEGGSASMLSDESVLITGDCILRKTE